MFLVVCVVLFIYSVFPVQRMDGWISLFSSVCSYITAISEVITDADETCEGMAKNDMGEARLDIIDSEINRE